MSEPKPTEWTLIGQEVIKGDTKLNVGDYIDYKANVSGYSDDNGWQVLGAENGQILLVSSNDVGTIEIGADGTMQITTLQSQYLTVMSTLQNICEPFRKGLHAISARSLRAEDVDQFSSFDISKFGEGETYEYGKEITFKWESSLKFRYYISGNEKLSNMEYHNGFMWFDYENNSWCKSTGPSSANTTNLIDMVDDADANIKAKIVNSFVAYEGSYLTEGSAAYNLLIKDGDNFRSTALATYSVSYQSLGGVYAIRSIGSGNLANSTYMLSNGITMGKTTMGVRAVVYLEANVELDKTNDVGSWTIKN